MGVVIKLPAIGPILVPVTAVNGEMPGPGFAQVWIGLLHTLKGIAQFRVFSGSSTREIASRANPVTYSGLWIIIILVPGATNPLQDNETGDLFGKDASK